MNIMNYIEVARENHIARQSVIDWARDKFAPQRRFNRHNRRIHAKAIDHPERRVGPSDRRA